jgi:glutathione S-transferase
MTHTDQASSEEGPRDVKLYMFSGSNAVRTAELMLGHKHIAYQEVILKRGAHGADLQARGFDGRSVPALEIDGRRVQRTREISRALDLIKPEPPLFPVNAADRVRVEDAERRGEELQNAVRRLFYCAMTRVRDDPIDRLAARAHGASDAAGRRDLAELPQRLNQIDAWIKAGVLDGHQLNAADLTTSRHSCNTDQLLPTRSGSQAKTAPPYLQYSPTSGSHGFTPPTSTARTGFERAADRRAA